MIRSLLLGIVLAGCVVNISIGQTVDDTRKASLSVNATATVTDNLQMLTIRNIDLIAPVVEENSILVSPISSPYAGMFKIIGNPTARIRITFLQRETLVESNDGFGEVKAEYSLSAAFEDLQIQSALLDRGEATISLSDKGILFVWLGANLDLSSALPGVYQSEFTIELEYI
ncbi:hypothetical protein [Algoriphagus sp.]|uniref:hypothetical protein n=1 Tax=Algoriphagus sp. TaxID=1872435 RepID=UPI0032722296